MMNENDLTTVFLIKGEPRPDGEFNHPPVGTWTGNPVSLEKVVVDARCVVPEVDFACAFESKLGLHILVFETEETMVAMIKNSRAEGTIAPDAKISTWPKGIDLSDTFQIVQDADYEVFFLCRIIDGDHLLGTNVVYANEDASAADAESAAYKHFDNEFTEPDDYEILVTGPYPLTWSK